MLNKMKLILWFDFIIKTKTRFNDLIYRKFWDILIDPSFVILVLSM